MSKSVIALEDIKNLEHLARLHVSDGDRSSLIDEVSSILVYIGQIDDLDMGTVDNSTMMHIHKNVTRPDDILSATDSSKQIIMNDAPSIESNFIKVTQVIKK